MKKIICIVLSVLMLLSFAACANTDKEVNTSTAEIEKAIADSLGDGYLATQPFDKETLVDYFGFDGDKIEDFTAKIAMMSAHNDIVVVLKTADGYADEAVSILNEFYTNKVLYGRDYPMNLAKLLAARIYKYDNYVMYIVAGSYYEGDDENEAAQHTLNEYKKIDDALAEIFGKNLENLAVEPSVEGEGGITLG